LSQPFGFAGEYTDPETGLIYLRARYHDPTTGQFLTRDPIEALTRSAYRYVDGNPLNNADPLPAHICASMMSYSGCRSLEEGLGPRRRKDPATGIGI